jgi:hypothetical protein
MTICHNNQWYTNSIINNNKLYQWKQNCLNWLRKLLQFSFVYEGRNQSDRKFRGRIDCQPLCGIYYRWGSKGDKQTTRRNQPNTVFLTSSVWWVRHMNAKNLDMPYKIVDSNGRAARTLMVTTHLRKFQLATFKNEEDCCYSWHEVSNP